MPHLAKVCALVLTGACAHVTEPTGDHPESRGVSHYTVTIDDDFRGARTRACVEGVTLRALLPIDESAARALRGAWVDGDAVRVTDGRIRLSGASETQCVTYDTRLRPSGLRGPGSDAFVDSQAPWLWRPEPMPSELDATVRFVLPAGASVSLPWLYEDGVYRPSRSAFFTGSYAVFGSFERQTFVHSGVLIDLAILGERPPIDALRRWISNAVAMTASVGGRFPRERLHAVVAPAQSSEDDVLFGMVRRGGGASILLIPSVRATSAELDLDWVAVHELSHLWLPRMVAEDRWLSEGIATYLQEVLRARCGRQSSERAWSRLRDGFERGRRAGTGRRLVAESSAMNRTGAYFRVYWAGAAFALEIDARLRKESAGKMSLLRAIDRAHGSWPEARPLQATVFLEALERASGYSFIRELGQRYGEQSDFPDVSHADSSQYRDVRAQIMAPADGACAVSDESFR